MTKKKLKQYAETYSFDNIMQPSYLDVFGKDFTWKGRWKEYFGNTNPIVVELGCGKGEYTVGLAEKYPQKNFVGFDIKGARQWKGCKDAIEKGLTNVLFIRTRIELLPFFFAPNEIQEIWITFPDPHEKKTRTKKRLTSPNFLARYAQVLSPEGIIHLKTDNDLMYEYTLRVIAHNALTLSIFSKDIYTGRHIDEDCTQFVTHYEKKYLKARKTIKYLQFCPGGKKEFSEVVEEE